MFKKEFNVNLRMNCVLLLKDIKLLSNNNKSAYALPNEVIF